MNKPKITFGSIKLNLGSSKPPEEQAEEPVEPETSGNIKSWVKIMWF